ncbi:MAG: hypothetical protein KC613_14185 [Myxococcales bacterium]|nr:hypothetical protein [Myxococcales bacterium]
MTAPTLALLAALLAPTAPTAALPTLYAGYMEVVGTKDVPVIGTLKTRNRTWFLAERTPTEDGGFALRQRICQVEFDRVMGVQVKLGPALLEHLPAVEARLDPLPGGFFGGRWAQGWDATDVDRDGKPGGTIVVDAPMCGGRLYVQSQTVTKAKARPVEGAIDGRIAVSVDQKILGADSACLKAASEDEHLEQTGWFRLVPVPADATCLAWRRADWPAAPGR